MTHGRERPPPACGESATYSLFARRRHARWRFASVALPLEHGRKFSLHQEWRKSRAQTSTPKMTARSVQVVSDSRAAQALPRLRPANVAIAQRSLPDDGDHFAGLAACLGSTSQLGEFA